MHAYRPVWRNILERRATAMKRTSKIDPRNWKLMLYVYAAVSAASTSQHGEPGEAHLIVME